MQISRRDFLKDLTFAAALVGLPSWAVDLDEPPSMEMMTAVPAGGYPWTWHAPSAPVSTSPILTALNRIAFGPAAGDFERVQAMTLDAYIEEQLHPETIDDSTLERRLAASYPTLTLSVGELMNRYPQVPRKTVDQMSQLERMQQLLGALGLQPDATGGPAEVANQLQEATLLRAIFSRRQLQEVLVDFWSTHFSIYIYKNRDKWMKTVDDREVIRAHAFGNFHDLLLASASSPAMLEYLDNRLNVKGVPNENYAREVMELHTLGVDGGYTQTDVQELARCLTGWTIRPADPAGYNADPANAGTLYFNPQQHDDGTKQVLGVTLPPNGGAQDGLRIIDILAHHPSTARFIASKLTKRFVADTPPPALVDRAAQMFSQTGGDIRVVLGVILHSDEFKNSFAQKIKRPFELVASTARALDMQLDDTRALALALRLMGQGLFSCFSPNGYPDEGPAWINTAGLLARWKLALLAANNRIPQATVDLPSAQKSASIRTVGDAVDFWTDRILHRALSDTDRQRLVDAVGGRATAPIDVSKLPALVALILASPHFQYR